jgi:hypothetical protein
MPTRNLLATAAILPTLVCSAQAAEGPSGTDRRFAGGQIPVTWKKDQWNHFALTWNASESYLNGRKVGSGSPLADEAGGRCGFGESCRSAPTNLRSFSNRLKFANLHDIMPWH